MAGLLWVTNIPAPYRVPVWQELAKQTNFKVAFLAGNEHNRQWSPEALGGVRHRVLKTLKVRHGEATFYVLTGLAWVRMVRQADTLILAGWENPASWQMLAAAKIFRKRTLGFYESTLLTWSRKHGPLAWLRRQFFCNVDGVLTVGTASTEAIASLGINANRIYQSFNAVDVETISRKANTARDGSPQHLGGGHRFVYVGQLIPRKNVAALIAAFNIIANQNDTLTIYGEGPLRDDLTTVASVGRLKDQIKFEGYVDADELPKQLGLKQTLVLPSTEEVWGLVVNEALACGLNVVVSDRCGVARDINGEKGVFICEPTADSLSAALRESRQAWSGFSKSQRAPQLVFTEMAQHILSATAARSASTKL